MWQPISQKEFEALYREQESELSKEEQALFDRYRTPITKAIIRRSVAAGDEEVFVVARCNTGVLYFDDVEYGFNISTVDKNDVILQPGGSQYSLAEAVSAWLPDAGESQSEP